MTEQQFFDECDRVLNAIEAAVDGCELDADFQRTGHVLTIELEDGGGKVIVNGHGALREIWLAARSGGFHFRPFEGRWIDTRSGRELFASLSLCLSEQSGTPVTLIDQNT